MKHYDPGHDPMTRRIGPTNVTNSDTASDIKQDLIDAEAKATVDPVGELTFVAALIEKLEALHKEDPEADLSLSVEGAWTASFETVVPPNDEGGMDQIAA